MHYTNEKSAARRLDMHFLDHSTILFRRQVLFPSLITLNILLLKIKKHEKYQMSLKFFFTKNKYT